MWLDFAIWLLAGATVPVGAVLILHQLRRLIVQGDAEAFEIVVGGLLIGTGLWVLTLL